MAFKLPEVPSIDQFRLLLAANGLPVASRQQRALFQLHAAAVDASIAYHKDKTSTGKREACAQALEALNTALPQS
jgi:hypothetical protein